MARGPSEVGSNSGGAFLPSTSAVLPYCTGSQSLLSSGIRVSRQASITRIHRGLANILIFEV
jgi:hypothetical protein